MRTITNYQCEVCGSMYDRQEFAFACEEHEPACPSHVRVGAEVRLENRNEGYTLAVVKGLALRQTLSAQMCPALCETWHEWWMELDRRVRLDHKWEEEQSWVPVVPYALTPEASALMERKDNHGW